MSSLGYKYEYKFDVAAGRWSNGSLQMHPREEKKVDIFFRAEYFLQRLPADGPLESLATCDRRMILPFKQIQKEDYHYLSFIRRNFSLLHLPDRDLPALISQLMDIAKSKFVDPQNSALLTLPIHFDARITIIVQQEEEEEEGILARAMNAGRLPPIFHVYRDPCTICSERLLLGDDVKFLPCLHRFHSTCINTWLRNDLSCPLCRRPVPHRR